MIGFLIPALNPPDTLAELVSSLRERFSGRVVVVDDGSTICGGFSGLAVMDRVTLVRHDGNQGKGAALRTGIRLLLNDELVDTIVTLDADGQHLLDDIASVADSAVENPDALVLGSRSFKGDVPFRSVIGNRLTRSILRLGYKLQMQDSQTGLRALPRDFAYRCLNIGSSRYGFELEMLLLARKLDVSIREVSIETIYIDQNIASHFRPVLDSLGVYLVFLRFSAVSLASFVVDIALFAIAHYVSESIFLSTYVARIASGTLNFVSNRQLVFRAGGGHLLREFAGYIVLALGIATASAFLVDALSDSLQMPPTLVKLLVDPLLFLISFLAQRFIVFRK